MRTIRWLKESTMKAPDFTLQDQNGTQRSLADYAGKWVVLYFYPKDDTPGCTTEACHFRDERDVLAQLGNAEVIGISKDSVASHQRFANKHDLNFTLLSDPDHTTIEAYGAWGPRKFMGREFMGTHRNTYIISPEGEIVKTYLGVNPKAHIKELLGDLRTLQKQ